MLTVPTYDDVMAAGRRLAGHAHRTPVVRSRLINARLGLDAVFKCENLQRAGAFKFRGALNAVTRLTSEQRANGVVAYSSGNHAQAIALAARLLEVPATIVVPEDAPVTKVAATKSYGAEVVSYNRYRQDRDRIAQAIATERGATLIPPYDHPDIIAGQGTAALELLEESTLDALFVPVGGGGLFSGCTLAARALTPSCRLIGVEPAAGNDAQRSLRAGRIIHIDTPQTIADGAQSQCLGELPFEILSRGAVEIVTASDAELVHAMRVCATYLKLIVEPTGCLGLAGLRSMAAQLPGARVGVVISGGNIDLHRYASMLSGV
ncbi:threo-3-hydroxy-L-aspartate ammonia-lyase [Nocardia sp. NPDC004168]|uniref:threo-3-hydroxy-L-aspartate ammonia-lyase n=1 Tax=Nocardia sp. NPDC004168 TaxID=3154452 RepID=UPI0033A74B99